MPDDDREHRTHRSTYRGVLAVAEFRALLISRACSTLGDYLTRAALVVTVYTETGSAALAGSTFALTVLPDLLGGPLLAGLADRYPRRAVMVLTDLARALLVLVMALLVMALPELPLPWLWALLFAARLIDPPFNSAHIATTAIVLPGRQLVRGTALVQLVNHLSYTVGYGLGGVAVATGGLSAVLVVNAATFGCSAALVLTGVCRRPAAALPGPGGSVLGGTAAAARYIARDPRLRLIIGFTVPIAATLAVATLAAPYAAQTGHGPDTAGVLMGAGPAGIVIGLVLVPMLVPEQRPRHVAALSCLGCAPLVLFLAEPGPGPALVLALASGTSLYFWIPLAAAFTRAVPDHMRGQAVGLLTTSMRATQGIAILVFGLAAQFASSATVIAAAGVAGTGCAVGLSVALSALSDHDRPGDP